MPLEEVKHKLLTGTGFKEAEKLAILDQLFPPKTFTADGKRWRLHVHPDSINAYVVIVALP